MINPFKYWGATGTLMFLVVIALLIATLVKVVNWGVDKGYLS